jgi:hypothetical protein
MTTTEQLRGLMHDLQGGGEFKRKEISALLALLIEVVERLERLERREEATTSKPGVAPPAAGLTPP